MLQYLWMLQSLKVKHCRRTSENGIIFATPQLWLRRPMLGILHSGPIGELSEGNRLHAILFMVIRQEVTLSLH